MIGDILLLLRDIVISRLIPTTRSNAPAPEPPTIKNVVAVLPSVDKLFAGINLITIPMDNNLICSYYFHTSDSHPNTCQKSRIP